MNRLFGLDYLRGLAAFSILLFHYFTNAYGDYNASTILGRVGIYGVAIFYMLSGITLYLVYFDKMKLSSEGIGEFFRKRAFRIFPLLWLTTFAGLVIVRQVPEFNKLFLNLTGLFGLFSWESYYATGAWSIGNELVFYLFFPVFIFLLRKSEAGFVILSAIITALFVFFAFYHLNAEQPLAIQWKKYTHPLNQVFLFLSGFVMAHYFKNVKVNNKINVLILLAGISLFLLIPAKGDLISTVTGPNRIYFTFSSLMISFSFFKLTYEFKFDRPLTFLGEASYSVYLLHPLVYRSLFFVPHDYKIYVAIPLTLAISYFVYEYFEKGFMKLGKKQRSSSAKEKRLQKEPAFS